MKQVDDFLNNITMYRLTLYFLLVLLGMAAVYSLFKILPYDPPALVFLTAFITAICYLTNHLFARVFKAQTNLESVYITALILALIISPVKPLNNLPFLFWVSVLAMASKYILALGKKHIFNPAAVAVAITALTLNQSATWWVGTLPMLPLVLIGGFLIARKIRREYLVGGFLFTALLVTVVTGSNLSLTLTSTSLFFLAFVMLTEPLTTPPTQALQILYGAVVGFLFAPNMHLGPIYTTPEIALISGNIFSYLVSPKSKLRLTLKEKMELTPATSEFIFNTDKKLAFKPGQYVELTLGHKNPDRRGNRRYFTIASSPTENELRFGIKFSHPPSSFKEALMTLPINGEVVASSLEGEFALPKDQTKKLVFMAGGIGVTPFLSMIKYLLETTEIRDITLLYMNKSRAEIVHQELFAEAAKKIGLRTFYHVGRVNEAIIRAEVPDFKDRWFYLSGPHGMVTGYEETLSQMGVSKNKIKTDYFPGFA